MALDFFKESSNLVFIEKEKPCVSCELLANVDFHILVSLKKLQVESTLFIANFLWLARGKMQI